MSEVAPARKRALFHDFKSSQTERPSPRVLCLERARSSAPAPLSIVRPANSAVPPDRRYVFVNDREAAFSQHSAYFVQHESRILRVMQHIAKQHRVKALISDREVAAVVRKIIDACGGAVADVQSNDSRSQQALQMMCDETVAAADVENVCIRRQHFRRLQAPCRKLARLCGVVSFA